MTAATAHATPYARRAHAGVGRKLERLAVVLGICLPIPLLAATGLSIPLPATVERIAAGLVPWANAATLDASRPPRGQGGSIIGLPGEGSRTASPKLSAVNGRSAAHGASASAPARAGERPASERPRDHAAPGSSTTPAQTTEAGSTASRTTQPGARAETPTPNPVAEPPPPPPPPPPAVEQPRPDPVRDTVKPVVDPVTQTVSEIVKVPDPGTVTGAVGGLVPGGK